VTRNVVAGFRSGNSLEFSESGTRPIRKHAFPSLYSIASSEESVGH
jgi:hypothetical protein